MKITKILWPTDFSGNAEKAFPYVQSLARKDGCEIHVVYVIQDIAHHGSWYGEFGESHINDLMEWAHKSAKKRLNQICDKYMDGCSLYVRHIAVGDPAEEILKLIEIFHLLFDFENLLKLGNSRIYFYLSLKILVFQ